MLITSSIFHIHMKVSFRSIVKFNQLISREGDTVYTYIAKPRKCLKFISCSLPAFRSQLLYIYFALYLNTITCVYCFVAENHTRNTDFMIKLAKTDSRMYNK